jgi:hypothetical protein
MYVFGVSGITHLDQKRQPSENARDHKIGQCPNCKPQSGLARKFTRQDRHKLLAMTDTDELASLAA